MVEGDEESLKSGHETLNNIGKALMGNGEELNGDTDFKGRRKG